MTDTLNPVESLPRSATQPFNSSSSSLTPEHPSPPRRRSLLPSAFTSPDLSSLRNKLGHRRPASYSSFASLTSQGGRVHLGGPSPTPPPPSGDSEEMRGAGPATNNASSSSHYHDDVNGMAQEELLSEQATTSQHDNPYTWERPLDTVNRHSQLLQASPISMAAAPLESRRHSRLPSGASFDPFGYGLAPEATPYDTAMNYSVDGRSSSRASFVGSSPFPSSSASMMSFGGGSTGGGPSGASSPVPWNGPPGQQFNPHAGGNAPWQKQRSASMGEQGMNGRASIRGGLLSPHDVPRRSNMGSRQSNSKLSGEIEADTRSLADVPSSSSTLPPADYSNSKLYQRTLKAQKALEKERAKAAAKGKLSKFDQLAMEEEQRRATTSKKERRQSSASSFMSDMPRRSLGWFRSSSEATLALPPPSFTPPLPASKSVSTLPLPRTQGHNSASSSEAPSPNRPPPLPLPSLPDSTQSNGSRQPSPRNTMVGASSVPFAPTPSPPPSRGSHHRPNISPRHTLEPSPSLDSQSRSNNGPARTPSPLSAAPPVAPPAPAPEPERREVQARPPRTDSMYSSSNPPSFDTDPSLRGRNTDRGPPSPSPTSSESSPYSPTTPRQGSTTQLGLGHARGPSLPPGAGAAQTYPVYSSHDVEPVRKRKSSLNLLLGSLVGGGGGGTEEPRSASRSRQATATPTTTTEPPPPTTPKATKPRKSFFGRVDRGALPTPASTPAAPKPSRQAQSLPASPIRGGGKSTPLYSSLNGGPPPSVPILPQLPPSTASSASTTTTASSNRLAKKASKAGASGGGGGFFSSFGRSRAKSTSAPPKNWTDLTNTGGARNSSSTVADKALPIPPPASPMLNNGGGEKSRGKSRPWGHFQSNRSSPNVSVGGQ